MRWIKKFEASSLRSEVRDELKEFCEMNLAYLMDDDYHVMITRSSSIDLQKKSSHHKKGLIIHFYKWQFDDEVKFKWNEVEDQFIPFLQRLSSEYKVVQCIIYYSVETGDSLVSKKDIVPFKSLLKGYLPKKPFIDLILIIVEEE